MDKHEADLWKRFDEVIARTNKLFGGPPIWSKITYTYTTNTTAEPEAKPGYTEGFNDGWNAHEASSGDLKG
jgi:hypothetical protein